MRLQLFERLSRWCRGLQTPGRSRYPSRGSQLSIEPLETRNLLAVLSIAQENQLQGTPASQWYFDGPGDSSIEGFATQMSVNHGQTVDFKISTDASSYHIDIYRLGYYGGAGARKITTLNPDPRLAQNQPDPIVDSSYATPGSAGLVDCGDWKVSASWAVPTDATSGIYFAELVNDNTGGENYIPFVVRNDEAHSDLLFKTSDETWQAYNDWGNSSLYGPNATTVGRSYKVSYNRPFNGPLDLWGQEYSMVRFLESNGYDVSYTSAIDVATRPSLLYNHKAILSVGHDEYWSGAERTNVEAARDAGVSLAFFSGNEVFWKTRWESSIDDSSDPYRTLVCYKESHNDATDPTGVWTGTWRDPRNSPPEDGGYPENELTGTIFTVNYAGPTSTAIEVPYAYSQLRFWRNTSIANLKPGQVASLPDYTLGGEWDEDLDNGFRPDGEFDLSSTTVSVPYKILDYGHSYGPGTATHALTLYRASSGALVFGAGTDMWAFGLDGAHDGDPYTPTKDIRMEQATMNLFADMGAQPSTIQSGLVRPTQSTDYTAPTSVITYPPNGITLIPGVAITITGTAQDGGGGIVTAVEVSVDGGLTWHRANGTTSWSYSWTPSTSGMDTILSRAVDDSGNIEKPGPGVTINPSVPGTTMFSLWSNATVPSTVDGGDRNAVEIGMKFGTNVDGFITGVRFYKSAANTGTHIANLWTSTGTLLATATFSNETSSGWQQVNFSTPVAIKANTTYVVSYYAPNGHYSVDANYFSNQQANSGPLHSISATDEVFNGLYLYGANAFPTNSFQSNNYWVDVVFNASTAAQSGAPTVTWTNPANNASLISTTAAITVAFNEPLNPATVNSTTISLRNASGNPVASTVAYSASNQTVTVTPISPLANDATYTINVAGGDTGVKDASGHAMAAGYTSSFTTIGVGPYSVWSSSTMPSTPDSGDAKGVELGMKFQSSVSGYITGVRFYKSSANTGTHVANLWTSSGTLLATATFTSETASGWQQVNFASPVAISANTVYVVSYHTSTGHYASDRNFFATAGVTSGPLTALATGASGSNGLYLYGTGGFPTSSFQSTNYYVDPVFTSVLPAQAIPPAVAGITPGNGTSSIAVNSPITMIFTAPLDPSTVNSSTIVLQAPGGTQIPVTLSMTTSSDINESSMNGAIVPTITLTPNSPLANGTTYTVVVKGGSTGLKDINGTPLANNFSSSFTTTFVPTVTAASPANGATGVAVGASITLTFNESLDPTSVNANNFGLKSANGAVAATVTYNAANQTVTIKPTSALAFSTNYAVVVNGGAGGVADLAGNSMASDFTLSFTTAAAVIPVVTSVSPVANATSVGVNSAITVAFNEALDPTTIDASTVVLKAGSTSVAASIAYNANTASITITPQSALSYNTTYTLNIAGGAAGAKDLSGNALAGNFTSSFTTAAAPATTFSFWNNSTLPGIADSGDSKAVELGMKFQSSISGYITGVRFYKSAGNTGVHVANLWTSTGTLLATATFNSETASGWQQVNFATPVAIAANTVYVVSYHTNSGHYSVSRNFFAGALTSGPLTALASSNGVYVYGAGGFPTSSFQSTNYWVDPLFTTTVPNRPLAVTSVSPGANATAVATNSSIMVGFSAALDPATVNATNFSLRNGNAPVAASVSYNAASNTVTITPTSALANGTTYTVSVQGGSSGVKDLSGNALSAGFTSSFTTAAAITGTYSLWNNSTVPSVVDSGDTKSVELGMKFRSDVNGYITGVRFYKSSANTGTHVANLWSATGALLATATFTNETGSGWQQVNFSSPVAVTANTVYVVSYHTTSGHYSVTRNFFTSASANSGPLHGLQNGISGANGVYAYGAGGFPTSSFQSSNYFVDVVMTAAPSSPAVTGVTPSDNSTAVAANAAVTVSFNEPLNPSSVSANTFVLLNASNNVVPATVIYNPGTQTVTVTPSNRLANATRYAVSVKSGSSGVKDPFGNVLLQDFLSHFTTS